ncbi:cytochrome c peroxidase [Gemmobacter fulvus]|uniref:cytochrome-c peroxidase n=1 Tax=Gemmobacter fulvus TaxID=2840474 RepID=UPI00279687F2|nr:cytochrome c peroxidase [Gemmobacter fulvus]MDQ1850750.1 cytochrome c peroxidase [Gemmobacter fulvus]
MRSALLIAFVLCIGLVAFFVSTMRTPEVRVQSIHALIRQFDIDSLGPVPASPDNALASNPAAIELGKALFADPRLSPSGTFSCATCHDPVTGMPDKNPVSIAAGIGHRRTMPIAGAQYSAWLNWDGSADSLWSQSLGPMENPNEIASTRSFVARAVLEHYRPQIEAVLPAASGFDESDWPVRASPVLEGEAALAWGRLDAQTRKQIDSVFVTAGKAIAAFERTLLPERNRLDDVLGETPEATTFTTARMSEAEVRGLELFVGEAHCVNCHAGPRFTDDFFHFTGVEPASATPDPGRLAGLEIVRSNPFNCLGPHSDDPQRACPELTFAVTDPLILNRAFRTSGLRGVGKRTPYMHAGQLATLREVIRHYIDAPAIKGEGLHNDLMPLNLTEDDMDALIAFLQML